MTPYNQITLKPGDQVTIAAGGCVQTGGKGLTWKRYVNPSGDNSDHLYHGMVFIPGAMGDPPISGEPPLSEAVRIVNAQGNIYIVKSITEPRKAHLWLGYEDDPKVLVGNVMPIWNDPYSDNGYWGHDNGSGNQCEGVGNAFAIVTITHGSVPPRPGDVRPFDLVLGNVDDNGILLNAKWAWQLPPRPSFPDPGNLPNPETTPCASGDVSSCTSQPTVTDNSFKCEAGGWIGQGTGKGHRNWAAGTYEGTIYWESHSSWIKDDDYNIRLVPPEGAGLTTSNSAVSATGEKSIEMEFDSDETIDNFDTPWWNKFRKAVDKSFSAASNMIYQRYAIVTGLIGLDCDHSCATELHPVWAMAIRVNDDPSDEVWAIFVRRWGNEGYCSDNQHYLDDLQGDEFVFRLPWRPGASTFGVSSSTIFKSRLGNATGPIVVGAPNNSVLVTFKLPVPQTGEGERVNGELHLHWTGTSMKKIQLPIVSANNKQQEESDDKAESRFDQLLTKMNSSQRNIFDAKMKTQQRVISFDNKLLPLVTSSQVASLPEKITHIAMPRVRAVPDAKKIAKDQRELNALQAAFENHIPTL